jgi:hypothetical protein
MEDGYSATNAMSPVRRSMHLILEMLRGGDRRSIGKSNEVVAMVLKEPGLFDALFSGLLTDDPLIRMRSADAAEKVTVIHPEYLAPYKKTLLKSLVKVVQAEVRWHVAPMLARLPLSPSEQAAVINVLTSYMNDRSSIVRTMAMQALYDLAERYEALRPVALLRTRSTKRGRTPLFSFGALEERSCERTRNQEEESAGPTKKGSGIFV